jgi:hypothetical protein
MWNNQNSGAQASRFNNLLDQLRTEYTQQFERAESHDAQG